MLASATDHAAKAMRKLPPMDENLETRFTPMSTYCRAWVVMLLAPSAWLDFTTWSGLFIIDEYLIWALVLGVAGWVFIMPRLPKTRSRRDVAMTGVFLAIFLALCIALTRAWLRHGDWGPNTLWSYVAFGNALRTWLGFAIALGVIPVLCALWRTDPEGMSRSVQSAFCIGALGVALTLIWERAAFPGLLNFSADYRTTGFFFDMRVGGAALDGYLALVMPFVLLAIVAHSGWRARLFWCVVFMLLLYGIMSTYSRALHLASVISFVFITHALVRGSHSGGGPRQGSTLVLMVALVCAMVFYGVFLFGGYRGLAAVVTWMAALLYSIRLQGWRLSSVGVGVALAAGLATYSAHFLPYKGPYVAFAVAAALWIGAAARTYWLRTTSPGNLVELTFPMAGAAVGVCVHWADRSAGVVVLLCICTAYVLSLGLISRRHRLALTATNIYAGINMTLLFAAIAVPVLSNYQMSSRLASTNEDVVSRLLHWKRALSLMGPSYSAHAFGDGLGSFPRQYALAGDHVDRPGTMERHQELGQHFVRLAHGQGREAMEPMQLSQRMPMRFGETLVLTGLWRSPSKAVLEIRLCEKWLLYPANCALRRANIASASDWSPFRVELKIPAKSLGPWYAPRFSSLSLISYASVDVANLSLTGATGGELLRNGDFAQGMTSWYMTNDHSHLPWHTKNMLLALYFDGGVMFLCAFGALGGLLWRRLSAPVAAAMPEAVCYAASLLAIGIVGVFDSVIDSPRLAFLFLVVCACALSATSHQSAGMHRLANTASRGRGAQGPRVEST